MQGPIYNSDEEIDLQEPVNDAKRSKGLRSQWVQCDNPECQKWRRIEYDADLDSLAQEKWICNMNEDTEKASCGASQESMATDDEDACYTDHFPGMVLWGKVPGYPWWPCIVDEDPDLETFFWNEPCLTTDELKTSIHVTFFGNECTRAWLYPHSLKSLSFEDRISNMGTMRFRGKNFKSEVKEAFQNAKECMKLPVKERLARYSFKVRYSGNEYTGNPNSSDDMDYVEADNHTSSSSFEDEKAGDAPTSLHYKDKVASKPEVAKGKKESKKNRSDKPTIKQPGKTIAPQKSKKKEANKQVVNMKECTVVQPQSDPANSLKEAANIDSMTHSNQGCANMTKEKNVRKKSVYVESKKASTLNNGATEKYKEEEFRKKSESWQLTREEINCVPSLVKPTIAPIDDKEVADMTEKLVKAIKNKEGKKGTRDLKKVKRDDNSDKKKTPKRSAEEDSKEKDSKCGKKAKIQPKAQEVKSSNVLQNGKSREPETNAGGFVKTSIITDDKQPGAIRSKKGINKNSKRFTHFEGSDATENKKIDAKKNRGIAKGSDTMPKPNIDTGKNINIEKDSSKISLKTKKGGFSVPRKRKSAQNVGSRDQSENSICDKNVSGNTAVSEQSLSHNSRSIEATTVNKGEIQSPKDKKKRKHNIIKQNSMPVSAKHDVVESNAEDALQHEFKNSIKNTKVETLNNSSKSENSYYKDSNYKNGNASIVKCLDAAEQRLDEIISFQEANEIIADSFAIASPKTKKKYTKHGRVNTDALEVTRTSPLVPENIPVDMPFSNLFKSEPLCGDINENYYCLSQETEEMDQVIPVVKRFDENNDDSSEF